MKNYLIAAAALLCSTNAFALDASELASLRTTVREICVTPDRIGDYLKTEGEVKVGAPVIVKIITGGLSGKLSYEKWNGISIAADKYKTDPRECAIEILKILQPALTSSNVDKVHQQSTGTGSPNVYKNEGEINIKIDGQRAPK